MITLTERDIVTAVQKGGLVVVSREQLLNVWLLPNQKAVIERVEAFCKEKDYEFDYNKREFHIWLKKAPETD